MVLIFGVVAHALDLMIPEAIRKKLEPMKNHLYSYMYNLLWYSFRSLHSKWCW